MKIYYIGDNYPEERCVIDKVAKYSYIPLLPVGNVDSVKKIIEKVQHSLAYRYSRGLGEKTLSSYWYFKRDGIVHTFNCCISGNNEWCATFETILPRTNYTRMCYKEIVEVDKFTLQQFKLLAKENCIACLALSQSTYNCQMYALEMIKEFLSLEEIENIRKKTYVLHPPQELLVTREEIIKKFSQCDELDFIFVGHDFFRKGGKEFIDCLMEYKTGQENENYLFINQKKVHFTIVSSMNYGDYASYATEEEMILYKKIVQEEQWITFYDSLPNDKVLELCKKAHIGVLPTFADTYGYSVLEMQACGCAMLTTDIRSLSEINNESCGWICHLPQNEMKEALYYTDESRIEMKKVLGGELKKNLEIIFTSDKDILLNKALKSWERIHENHNPEKYANTLTHLFKRT